MLNVRAGGPHSGGLRAIALEQHPRALLSRGWVGARLAVARRLAVDGVDSTLFTGSDCRASCPLLWVSACPGAEAKVFSDHNLPVITR